MPYRRGADSATCSGRGPDGAMTRASLQLRLALAGVVVLVLTLAAAQVGLSTLFTRHAERAIAADLSDLSDYLIAELEPDTADAFILPTPPVDPAYMRPYSGRYWWVTVAGQEFASRSLWDFTLDLPAPPPPGEDRLLTLPGPQGTQLLALDRTVIRVTAAGDRTIRVVTLLERSRIDLARNSFEDDMLPWLAGLGLLVFAAGAVQIRVGLAPLSALGARLTELTEGRVDRIGGDVPSELRPLARQIDALLDDRAEEIARSRRRAADLAHGLKTPLQALLGDASSLRSKGMDDQAGGIETVVRSIQQQVDRELARATMAGGALGSVADVGRCLHGIIAVMTRTPKGSAIDWALDVEDGLLARIDPADLTEALGALIENAAHHAKDRVAISLSATARHVTLIIRDDGPGLPPDQTARLRQRGQRLDLQGGGSGLGLSIADEIVAAAGGELDLANADTGLLVTVRLPSARKEFLASPPTRFTINEN